MGRALFSLFLALGVINSVKSLYKQKNYTPQNGTCVTNIFFCHISFEQNYSTDFPNNPHSKQDPGPLGLE